MTDKPNVDTSGAGETTNPPVSKLPVEGAEALSGLVESVVSKLLDVKLKPIQGDISGIYSRQDKAENAQRELLAEFKKGKAKGLSDEEAESAAEGVIAEREKQKKRDLVFDKLAEQFMNSPSGRVAGNDSNGADALANVIGDEKLDPNSAEVINILANGTFTPEGRELALRRLATANRNKQPASPASAPALQSGGQSISPNDISSINDSARLYEMGDRKLREGKQ